MIRMQHYLITFTSFSLPLWIDFAIAAFMLTVVNFYIFKFVRRKGFVLPFLFLTILFFVNYWLVQWSVLTLITIVIYLILCILFMILNVTELKARIDVMFQFGREDESLKIINYDKEMIYEILYDAVSFLSKNKTGALITLERTTKLDEFTKNGVIINAPISAEILTTIFYPGTRLHDGAVIIRGSFILAASVYYQPTTKPVLGKLGSRHRAAIGISETTDAVTIIVSEETGRLSMTYGGQLETVYLDTFKQMLANYMENRPHFEKE
jgi:diadenylate cyclase